jgi:general secretion pathway protein H
LLELLLVVGLVALATAGVGLALPDPAATQLEREARRLTALLEAGRAQARTTGVAVVWQTEAHGFALDGQRRTWLAPGTQARLTNPPSPVSGNSVAATRLALGPEPLMAPQEIALTLGERTVRLGTDGLRPFALRIEAPPARP